MSLHIYSRVWVWRVDRAGRPRCLLRALNDRVQVHLPRLDRVAVQVRIEPGRNDPCCGVGISLRAPAHVQVELAALGVAEAGDSLASRLLADGGDEITSQLGGDGLLARTESEAY